MIKLVRDVEIDYEINFDLEHTHNFIPKSESIKKYIDSEIERVLYESLLEDKDVEMLSFKPSPDFIIRPYFNGIGDYNGAGFTDFYITANTLYIEESFYLFDIYDSFSDNNQKLLSRNFAKGTKVIRKKQTDIAFENKTITKEFANIYIPTYFTYTGDTCYMKIQFFNSTNGKLRYFKCNDDPTNQLDNSKNYLKIFLDKTNNTYKIIGGDILTFNPNVYKISEVIEPIKEKEELNNNITTKLKPNVKTEKIITNKGRFI
jgi:hypothetical protein